MLEALMRKPLFWSAPAVADAAGTVNTVVDLKDATAERPASEYRSHQVLKAKMAASKASASPPGLLRRPSPRAQSASK